MSSTTATSERQEIALELADFVAKLGLNTAPACGYLGKSEREKGKPHVVCFGVARHLDATIRVWGPTFIHLRWATTFRDMPEEGYLVFEDINDAKEFIDLAFVKHEVDEAMTVPTKA